MQYQLDTSGWSHVSLLDAGLGVGAGFAVPLVANALMNRVTTAPQWVRDYQPQLAAAVGLGAAIPLYFWRGFGPAVIAGMMAVAYGFADLVQDYLEAPAAATSGIRAQRAMGVISATPAQRRLPAGQRRLSGIQAVSTPAFQGTNF